MRSSSVATLVAALLLARQLDARTAAQDNRPIPTDLVGSYVAPADQSDQVFNR